MRYLMWDHDRSDCTWFLLDYKTDVFLRDCSSFKGLSLDCWSNFPEHTWGNLNWYEELSKTSIRNYVYMLSAVSSVKCIETLKKINDSKWWKDVRAANNQNILSFTQNREIEREHS